MHKYNQEYVLPSLLPEQWVKQVDKIARKCDNACSISRDLRQKAAEFRTEAENHILWGQHRTKASIAASIEEIQRWQTALEKCHSELKMEIGSIQTTLNTIGQCEDDVMPMVGVTRECVLLREQRRHPDDVRDSVHRELESEINLLEEVSRQLYRCFNETTETLRQLGGIQLDVEEILRSKTTAKEIEETQLNLTQSSSGISLKPPIITPTMTVTKNWERSASELHSTVTDVLRNSWTIRKSCQVLCKESTTRLKTQHEVVNYELRKSIHQFQQVILELEWREKKLVKELEEAGGAYHQMDKAFNGNIHPLKLAQTILRNRNFDPRKELSGDVRDTIAAEVDGIYRTRDNLRQTTQQLASEMTTLENHLQTIKDNLTCKRHSLSIDIKCLELRKKQAVPSRRIPSAISIVPCLLDKPP